MSAENQKEYNINIKSGEVTEKEDSFFDKRMKEIGVDEKNIMITSQVFHDGQPLNDYKTYKRFEEDQEGNIQINYFNLDGHEYKYKKDTHKWPISFSRKRLKTIKKDKTGKEQKYESAKGSGNFPYFTPQIIEKYKKDEEINLLIIVEGEFKAVVGCNHGLNVVGVSGIHNFYSNDGDKRIHPDIIKLIISCKVKKILFMTDADTRVLKYKPEKELSDRPNFFFSSVKNFREAILNLMDTEETSLSDIYFGNIKAEYNKHNQKGLDDLLNGQAIKDRVTESLKNLSFDNAYFEILNISDGNNKIKEHFGLKDANNFYLTYQEFIEEREFIFHNQTYVWKKDEEKIEKIRHSDIDKFLRVGCDWFKVVYVPNKYKELEEEIKKWKVSEISRDYGRKYQNFLDDVPKFDAWCNVPCMTQDYKRVHNGCFNLFNPLKHNPGEGSIDSTLFFIKHLFEGMATVDNDILGDPFTVALDYLTLMFQNPTQILPVLCLVSPENGTGKSTFLKWLKDVYGSNATIIDNERFKQSFNSHYITKYIIGIDEGFLDVDKRAEKERLKKLATDDKQFLEFKGADVQEVDFYAKIIICSNDADSLMKIEEGEIRWFVVRVHSFASKGYPEDPKFREKLRSEIPAWINFLKNRKIFHPFEGRAWFDPKHIETDQLRIIIEKTRNRVEKVLEELIKDMFITYRVSSMFIDVNWIVQHIKKNGLSKYAIDAHEVKNYLKDKRKMSPIEKPSRVKIPTGFDEGTESTLIDRSYVARYFEFFVEDWIKDIGEYNMTPGREDPKEEEKMPF